MRTKYLNSKAYDIELGENRERILTIYDVYCDSESRESTLADTIIADGNLESLVEECRKADYKNINDYFNLNQSFECDNIIADAASSLFKSRFKILDKFYYPQIVDFKSYIMGGVIFVDLNTGKEYFIRTKNFGIESEMVITYLQMNGYHHINETELKDLNITIGILPTPLKIEPGLRR